MIGTITFDRAGTRHVATLSEDGSWSIDPPLDPAMWAIGRLLELISEDYGGPWDGPFGPRQLAEAAQLLEGTATIHPSEPMPPGTIY